jgi:lipoprotein-releasing system ATP-binding protein
MNNVNKFYGKIVPQQVLYDIDLSIEANTFNSIIGQSGSGKSTLLNIMGSLDKPSDGQVFINGKEISKLSKNNLALLRNKEIGFIFQFHFLLPEFTVFENILLPYNMTHRKVTNEIVERAEELMRFVDIINVRNNKATAISGGQAQRTAIARALINNPKIILADEPTGNLDSASTEIVYKLLRSLNDNYGTTFVVITHNPIVAEKTDRIIEIKDGRVNRDYLT